MRKPPDGGVATGGGLVVGQRVEMLVTTMRSRSENPGEMFSGERGACSGFCQDHRINPAQQCSQGGRSRVATDATAKPGNGFRDYHG